MSYCVNCGVELGESEKKCPLCDTVVINPKQAFDDEAERPYPSQAQKLDFAENKGVTAGLITALFALPASICLVCNYVIEARLSWSLYVAAAMALLWLIIVPIYLIRRNREIMAVLITTVSLCGFLRFVEKISPMEGWYLTLALPIVLVVAFCSLIMVIIVLYSSLRKMQIAAVAFLFIAGGLVAVEITTDVYHSYLAAGAGEFSLGWSLFLSIPCLIFAVLWLLVDRKRSMKEGLKKRFHV